MSEKKTGQPVVSNVGRFATKQSDVGQFLSSFKTTKCPDLNRPHDHRRCDFFHNEKDQRRNPFAIYYSLEEAKNLVEKMYHPDLFRTQYCKRKDCPFQTTCAHAHRENELRDRDLSRNKYFDSMQRKAAPSRSLCQFVEAPKPVPAPRPAVAKTLSWDVTLGQNKIKKMFWPLKRSSIEWFMVRASKEFWAYLKVQALEVGWCSIELRQNSWENDNSPGIYIKGMDVHSCMEKFLDFFAHPPSDYFRTREEEVKSQRVLDQISELLEIGQDQFVSRKFQQCTFVELYQRKVRACALKSNGSEKIVLDHVFDKLQFWIQREGYDKLISCTCCFEDRNMDEGISCEKGHFFCSINESEENCFNMLVKSTIPQLKGHNGKVLCTCGAHFQLQAVANHLPTSTWELLQEAVMDIKVQSRVEKLESEFDCRLKKRIEELMDNYGSALQLTKEHAKINAAEARNDALNLKCPHCCTVYAEFDGCMALCCATCKGNFCGYCHKATESSSGAHSHVRECLMNETSNGSYYATPEEIRNAQRRYRTRQIKKFLRKFKKNEQNAIIIELKDDLSDLGIDPAALFELGDLQN